MRVLLAVVLGFALQLSAQSLKDTKIQEIDNRIAELQREIDGLQALKTVVSSGQLPDAALSQIIVGSSGTAENSPGPAGAAGASGIVGPTGGRFHISAPGKKLYYFPAKK